MVINPPRVSSQADLSRWMCELHNEVNYRMNKPMFDCSKVGQRWKTGPPDGRCSQPTTPTTATPTAAPTYTK
jgi:FAD-linked sulfhydryl oxidase